MALTLTDSIDATQREFEVTGAVTIEPGYRFRLGDELLELQGFVMPRNTVHVVRNLWYVRRGLDLSTAATHANGTEVKGATDAFVSASGVTPPDPFASTAGATDLDAVLAESGGQDIADALTGAAAPDSGNVFATMADVGGGGGGGALSVFANGLVKDWSPQGFDPDTTRALVIDADAQDWLAETLYRAADIGDAGDNNLGSFVHAVGDDAVSFKASVIVDGTTGASEPVWVPDAATDDGNMCWHAPAPGAAWQALTVYDGSAYVLENGRAWLGIGTSDSSEPDWSSAPDIGDSVGDGTVTWVNQGTVGAWQALTTYSYHITADGSAIFSDFVTPVTPDGTVRQFNYRMGTSAMSGTDEPTWDVTADHFTLDGELIWVQTTDTPQLTITGILAPSGTNDLSIACVGVAVVNVPDQATYSGYPDASADANTFDNDGSDLTIDQRHVAPYAYTPAERWMFLTVATL